eukprot:COSAG01_NODE_2037_length_8579_cov_119.860849_6_plen_160_part_00
MPQDNDANDTSAAEQPPAKRLKSEVAAGGVEGLQQQDDAVDGATVHYVDGSNVHESPRSEDEVQSALLLGSSSSSDDEDAYREAETESDDDSDDSAAAEAEMESDDDGAAVDVGGDMHQPHRFNFASAPPSEVADIMRCANQHCLSCCYCTYKKRHDMA